MSTVVIAAYRHGRLRDRPLAGLYEEMDRVVAGSFPGRFATGQIGRLDTVRGELSWVNAGHPPALWVRDGRVAGELTDPVTRPIGFGGAAPHVHTVRLEPGDRVLFFTDGVVEERLADGEQFGEERLRQLLEQTTREGLPAAESVRRLSHALMAARSGPHQRRRLPAAPGVERPAARRRAGPRRPRGAPPDRGGHPVATPRSSGPTERHRHTGPRTDSRCRSPGGSTLLAPSTGDPSSGGRAPCPTTPTWSACARATRPSPSRTWPR